MSLDKLASEIASLAKAEAKTVTDAAVAEAKSIGAAAGDEISDHRGAALARAEKMRDQSAVESIAAARQRNQKRLLVARAAELDATWDEIVSKVASAKLDGREGILNSLLAEAKESASADMILRPVAMDRAALSAQSSGFKFADDIDGLGGFVLETADGSILMDYRFEGRLREAWEAKLGEVSRILFGNE